MSKEIFTKQDFELAKELKEDGYAIHAIQVKMGVCRRSVLKMLELDKK